MKIRLNTESHEMDMDVRQLVNEFNHDRELEKALKNVQNESKEKIFLLKTPSGKMQGK